jgi:putative oxygen-independent coproporphyrinogen III oxidase
MLPTTLQTATRLTSLPPLSLYVHLPWCLKKCPYCDFNSHAQTTLALPEQEYLRALELDLEQALPQVWGRSVQTIFIGGGTPSLFSAAGIGQLLACIRARIKVAPAAEITLEANPGTFEAQRFADYAAAGVTRLSIGAQSFDSEALQKLGRVHDAAQAKAAAQLAAKIVKTWNIDLMYGLPDQTVGQAQADLAVAIELDAPHISLYNLTLEPNTEFARQPPNLPDDDTIAAMQDALELQLVSAGYRRYEISAWAKAGHSCQHNRNYWEFGDYLGIGAGAHSKLSFHNKIERQIRYRTPAQYMTLCASSGHISQVNVVEPAALPFEFMLNALRLIDGVVDASFADRTGLTLVQLQKPLTQALQRGLLDPAPGRFKATPLGLRFLNDLQALFLI